MIIDKLENISLYKEIPNSVVKFLKDLDVDNLEFGKHILEDSNFVNIETYDTKPIEKAKYESHDNYIDIQMLLKGNEKIGVINRNGLVVMNPYDKDRDITFYTDKVDGNKSILLDGSNFVMLFTHEAHAPQIAADYQTSENVIKLVAKVKV